MIINNEIQIPTERGLASICLKNIIQIEAISNYSKLYMSSTISYKNGVVLKSNILVVAKVLKWFDKKLTPNGFIRIHRNRLVNINFVTNKTANQVQLLNTDWFNISRRKRNCFN
ncbi:MAG: LytTR family DNA-binding domain-containing protein [Ferruginibacter sp.]|nr:LytTR family transcriptional regulator [Ferruginibacter sp.]